MATPLGLSDSPTAFQGTLLTPRTRAKARPVLIIAGSGPTDRNGDSLAFGVKAPPYKLLAEGLAARGVTTLRYDKRGIGGSKGAGGRAEDLRLQHYADDARAWAARLRAHTRADCVWLLGHSEGALLAEMAAQNNPDACGLILVAVPGRRISEVLREQLRASPANAPLLPVALPAVAELEAGRTVDSSGFPAAFSPSSTAASAVPDFDDAG